MADAEIIPLGTRGRPGRGSGRDNPSSSSRALAGNRAPRQAAEPAESSRPPVEDPAESSRPPVEDLVESSRPPAEEPVESSTPDTRADGSDRRTGFPLQELVAAATRAAHVVFGDDAERRLAELLAVLRRRVTGDYSVDEYGLDPDVAERLLMETVRPLATKWFRVEVRGVENIPADGGALVVANHSGTGPLDGLMTMFAIHETTGRNLRPLGADLVFRLPFIGELARKSGATLACNEDASRLLSGGELAGVWPEGFKGIGKPYSERYKLQRFGRGGFVSAAIRTGVPIVPCSIVGAEEIYPLVGNVPFLARLLGVPYIPITPFFPLLGPLGLVPLPSKWIIEFGEPIRTDSYDPGAADDPMLVFNVTDQVRETIQQTLYTLLMRRKSVFH
ncbi:MAG TPA: lysophospholipid acyltransferase family protein [Marmoricola sp.]|nr:lysophospholipid acyltransferase family protein [Marmoricola sp.]